MLQNIRMVLLPMILLFIITACSAGNEESLAATFTPEQPLENTTPTPRSTATEVAEPWWKLDLRYAHILEVTYTFLDTSQVRFDVTLIHDDDGEAPQYADWWQVEDLSGILLGKRILTHAHGTQPFTRSATIDIPVNTEVVIIRAHDMLHGFGGQIMQLNMITGEQQLLATYP